MIATELGIRIQFRHDKDLEGDERLNAITTCYLVDETQRDIGVGEAFCVKEDQFNKEIGRRLALTRALANTVLDKDARRQIWEAYFGRNS